VLALRLIIPVHERDVESDELVKGWEVAKGQFMVKAGGYQKAFDQPAGGPRGEVPLDFFTSGLPEGNVSLVVKAPLKGVPGTAAVKFQVDFYHTRTAPR